MGRLLSELPAWISRTAARKLNEESAGNAEEGESAAENRTAGFRKQRLFALDGGEESLVYRIENQNSLRLSELWEQSSQEEKNHLLYRIPQAVRKAAFLWEETGQGDGGSHQDKILKAILERMEAVGRLGITGNSGTAESGRESGSLATAVGKEAASNLEAGQPPEIDQLLADPKRTEKIGRLLSELPVWISRTAARKLNEESTGNVGEGEEVPENRTSGFQEQKTSVDGGEENLVYRMENLDSLRLSELWKQSVQEERKRLLRRIPQAISQAASLWKERGEGNGGPRQEIILKSIVERLEAAQRPETMQGMETAGNLEKTWSLAAARKGKRQASVPEGKREALVYQMEMLKGRDRHGNAGISQAEDFDGSSRERMLWAALTWLLPPKSESLLAAKTSRKKAETFYRLPSQRQMNEIDSLSAYPSHGESAIVYAAKAQKPSGVHQKNEEMQAIQELESRISRQEYIIKQEQAEREELRQRMKKQESREEDLWKLENMKITSKQGGDLSPDLLAKLKEQLRLERIRYGAD